MFFCNIITTWGRKDFQKFGGWEVKFHFFHKNHFCETCGEWNEGKLCIFTAHETHIWNFLALGRERKNKDWLLSLTLNEFQPKGHFLQANAKRWLSTLLVNVIHRFWSLYNEDGAEEMSDGRAGGHNKIFSLDLPAQYINGSAQTSLLLTSKFCPRYNDISGTSISAKQQPTSVTRWLEYVFNIWPFLTFKIYPIAKTFANIGSQFGEILFKNCQRLSECCQSGEFSPNLVTLQPTYLQHRSVHFCK